MVRSKGSKPGKDGAGSWKDRLHVVDFSYEDELIIADWYESSKPEPYTCLEELLDGDWSIRVTPPSNGNDFWCSATYKGEGRAYSGHTYTVKYPDCGTVIILVYYVVYTMLEDGRLNASMSVRSKAWLER
jgi:hypothetical protein